MNDDFYEFFESINYASEESVADNRRIYTAFVRPLPSFVESPLAIDFGCGRGEWLDMLRALGFRVKGVDLDKGMLKAALRKGLDVAQGDGLAFLQAIADESVSVLTAFHVLEHLSFEKILDFFAQSQRVLMPGGLLIVETPNPENIHVATSNFYLDPTHVRPIPILQMIALARYFHYDRYSVVRLQEDKSLYDKEDVTFRDLIFGVSKDYGLIAQKPGGSEGLVEALKHPLQYETGIGLDEMIKRLDQRLEKLSNKIREFETYEGGLKSESRKKDRSVTGEIRLGNKE